MSDAGFGSPRNITDPRECFFYHTMDLPGLGLQVGMWDLRGNVATYLGDQSFAGKRVVDVGTASGYLCFEMENRGADVIAFDRLLTDQPTDDMGLVPFAEYEPGVLSRMIHTRIATQRRMQTTSNRQVKIIQLEIGTKADAVQHNYGLVRNAWPHSNDC